MKNEFSVDVVKWALFAFFNAQPKMEAEFGPEMAERQRLDLLNGLKRQEISASLLMSAIEWAAENCDNSEAKANPIETFERLIGEKLENIAAS